MKTSKPKEDMKQKAGCKKCWRVHKKNAKCKWFVTTTQTYPKHTNDIMNKDNPKEAKSGLKSKKQPISGLNKEYSCKECEELLNQKQPSPIMSGWTTTGGQGYKGRILINAPKPTWNMRDMIFGFICGVALMVLLWRYL